MGNFKVLCEREKELIKTRVKSKKRMKVGKWRISGTSEVESDDVMDISESGLNRSIEYLADKVEPYCTGFLVGVKEDWQILGDFMMWVVSCGRDFIQWSIKSFAPITLFIASCGLSYLCLKWIADWAVGS